MITITVNGQSYECATAVKGDNFIVLYDENNTIIASFFNVSNFDKFSISGGDWTPYVEKEIVVRTATLQNGTIVFDDYSNIETGTSIKLRSPANSEDITQGISIDGTIYQIINTNGEVLSGKSTFWISGSIIELIIDKTNYKAYVTNYSSPIYYPKITVISFPNSEISCSKGDIIFTKTIEESGLIEFELPSTGAWTINANYKTLNKTEIVSVNDPSNYTVTIYYVSPVLAENSWEEIAIVAESGKASSVWEIGDVAPELEVNADLVLFEIIGFNHDELESGGTAGITFGSKTLIGLNQNINNGSTAKKYTNTTMYDFVSTNCYQNIKNQTGDILKTVKKKTLDATNKPQILTENMITFNFSATEVFGDPPRYGEEGEGSQYAGFATTKSRLKTLSNSETSVAWWLRSPQKSTFSTADDDYCFVDSTGREKYDDMNNSKYVCFGFCI